jgi:glycosyltransferase involved in cell wall biosynthesis
MSKSNEPLVSVVTPFYNTEKYLAECIESVIAQTYRNWEYVLLNNCSTDKSLEIAQSYVERDSRIRLKTNSQFLGQVQNYNNSLRLISPESKYCKIVQADDWIFPECITEMVHLSETYPTVGVVGSYWLRGEGLMGGGLPYPSTFMPGSSICNWQLSNHPDKHILTQPTAHLIRSDLIRNQNPFYDENIIDFEDYDVWFRILQKCDFAFVHKVLTFQRVDNASISAGIRDFSPNLLSAFICLNKYGRLFMLADEYNERLRVITERYYATLAKALVLSKNNKKMMRYHTDVLKSVEYTISSKKLAKYTFLEILDALRHPKLLAKILKTHFF